MKLRNRLVKVLNGIDIESLLLLLARKDRITTARRGHNGWMGSIIIDGYNTEPIVTTIKKYATKAKAIEALLDGLEIGF